MSRTALNKIQYVKLKSIKSYCFSKDGKKDLFGLLERPNVPLSVEEYKYRIFVAGGAGVGKSFLISWLTGLPPSHLYLPTPGIQTATSHYPAILKCSAVTEVLFSIQFRESGASSKGLSSGLFKDCPDDVDAVMLLFAYTDRKSFELLPQIINQFSNQNKVESPCFFAVSIGYFPQEQPAIMHKDVIEFEKQWKVPVLTVPCISAELDLVTLTGLKEALITSVCEGLWLRDQNLVLTCRT